MKENLAGAIPADDDDPFGKTREEEKQRRRRRRRMALAGAVVVVLVGVGLAYVIAHSGRCGPGVDRIAGECIGITDGAVDFDPRMHTADQLILAENRAIAKQKQDYVTVAFLGALSVTQEHNLTGGRAVHEVEGAYIAQKRANNGQGGGDTPKIKLVLANEGADQGHWGQVVDQLVKMRDSDHLVAVAGFGISTKETVLAAQRLSAAHIAMVSDVTTGDGIDTSGAALQEVGGTATRIDGLTRVALPVNRQVAVMADYLRGRVKSADMVVDRKATDLYSRSLATDFHAAFKDALKAGGRLDEPFALDSPFVPGAKTQYATVARNLNLCGGDPPDIVLYAGRAIFLPGLIGYLETCEKEPITIVTGSDAEGITGFPAGHVSVIFTPLAEVDQLKNSGFSGFKNFYADGQRYYPRFSDSDLQDNWAIMAHDAVLTAANAVRLARGGAVPSSADVTSILYNLHESSSVTGASGNIEMDSNGNPFHPVVNIVRLSADGSRQVLHTTHL